MRVNPWNYAEVAEAIRDGLTMGVEEKVARWNELNNHVCTNTAQFWAGDFVSELVKVHEDMQQRYSIHLPHFKVNAILPEFRSSKKRL